jgi:DNA-binding CsgD family transcriptional regulator
MLAREAREADPVGHRISCPDFVGRAEELDVLGATFESVADGQPATVLVGGDAGIGKTRLVEEFCRRARAAHPDMLVAVGVCVPTDGGGLPYGPVAGILRDVVRQLGEAAGAEALGPLVSGVGLAALDFSVGGGAFQGGRHTDDLAKTRLFELILAGFTALARRQPVVLVFDDLQWADSASAELLRFLTRNLADTPVLMVGTYRSEEVGPDHELRPWLAELGRHTRVTHLRVEGLDRDELTTMIAAILGHQPDWTVVDAVWARSQGNPFFAEELTAAGPSPTLPPELARVIMTRVESLSKKTHQLLRVLAVAGMAAEHRLLAVVADGFDTDGLDAALAEAVDNQVVLVDESRTGYRFRHALLREAVDASLLPGERVRLHHRLAEAVAADASLVPGESGQRAATLAGHWWEAGDWAASYAASVEAAAAATSLWAFPEAFVHFERALAALERMPADARPETADRLRLLDEVADVAYLVGAGTRSVELAQAAIDATDASLDAAGLARRYALLGRNAWGTGDSDAAFDNYRKAVELMPADPPSAELARVMAEEARGIMLMARYRESERRCLDAIAVARAVGARAEEGHALYTLGCCRGSIGYDDEGIALIREALAIAEEVGSPDDLNRAYMGLSNFLVESGQLEEGAALVFDSAAMGEALWGVRLNGAAGNSADALIRLGRYDDAAALLAQTGDRGVGTCITQPLLLQTTLAIRRGLFDEAHRSLTVADRESERLGDVQQRGAYHIAAAELAIEQGRGDDAFEDVERALDLAAGTDDLNYRPEMCALGVRALADRVDEAHTRRRPVDVDKARLLAHGLVEDVNRMIAATVAGGGRCPPRTSAFASSCAAEESRLFSSDPQLWARAAAAWETAGEPYPVAYCRWREAEALLTGRAQRSKADESLQAAWTVASQLGAGVLTERIEHLARRARIALHEVDTTEASPASTLASDLGLTPREVEVLAQLATGKTDKEIADTLFISKKTVSVHVSNLLRKLDVANRVEAGKVGQAHQLG